MGEKINMVSPDFGFSIGPNKNVSAPEFDLSDVVCGQFVQRFFYLLAKPE